MADIVDRAGMLMTGKAREKYVEQQLQKSDIQRGCLINYPYGNLQRVRSAEQGSWILQHALEALVETR